MKAINTLLIIFLLSCAICSCKKEDTLQFDGGALNITNAVIGGSAITPMNLSAISSASNSISVNNSSMIPIPTGQVALLIGVPAIPATATAPAVPAVIYYNQTIAADNITNYSLFLTGTSPAAVDNVLIKESYTMVYADSVCGVRFINLAPGSVPISVNIKGNANGSEVTSIAYKSFSDFKQYPAKSTNKTLVFEIREASTGKLLYPTNGNGFTLTIPYFHNVTLCYRGTGTSVGIIVNNDY